MNRFESKLLKIVDVEDEFFIHLSVPYNIDYEIFWDFFKRNSASLPFGTVAFDFCDDFVIFKSKKYPDNLLVNGVISILNGLSSSLLISHVDEYLIYDFY